jgi:phenylalanyl-tRNA synthetase beta chain
MPVINFSYSDLCDLVGREVSRDVLREKLPLIGADLKSVPDDGDELSFEFFPDRPDLFSVEGIARAVRAFFGYEPGLRSYKVDSSEVELSVDSSVKDVRPYIWSALVEGNEITDPLIRSRSAFTISEPSSPPSPTRPSFRTRLHSCLCKVRDA